MSIRSTITIGAAERLDLVLCRNSVTCSIAKDLGFSEKYHSNVFLLDSNNLAITASHSHPNIKKIEIAKEDGNNLEIVNGKTLCNVTITFEGFDSKDLNGSVYFANFPFRVLDQSETKTQRIKELNQTGPIKLAA